jgi:CheY-like chemotaxis protein
MSPETNPLREPPCIMVVEDEVLIRAALAERLRMKGVSVVEAANADEAWSYLEAGGAADLIFSDVRLGGSMDGAELARRVREKHPAVAILLTSATTPPPGIDRATFIAKPYDFPRIVVTLLRAVGIADPDAP